MKCALSIVLSPLLAMLFPTGALGEVYRVGDSLSGFSAPDQHGNAVTIDSDTARFILFDTPDASPQKSEPEDPKWLEENEVLLMVNISDFSSLAARIARSRMKSRPFRLLVVGEKEVAARFPVQKGKFTVLMLNDQGVITNISFATPGPDVKKLVADARE